MPYQEFSFLNSSTSFNDHKSHFASTPLLNFSTNNRSTHSKSFRDQLTDQPFNLSTFQPFNLSTYQLINLFINSSTNMNPHAEINIDGFFDDIISSYETRIQKIQSAFQSSENLNESTHSLFGNVQNSLSNLRKERDVLNSKLCETVAKNGSLRKKDYHTMMAGILNVLDEKEKEAETQFLFFIEAQKITAQSLKNSLLDIKDITSEDITEKISLVKEQLSRISELQEVRKATVMKTFLDFQQMHNKMMICLEHLLEKGDHIQIQDIKMVKDQIIKDIIIIGQESDRIN